MRPPGWSWKPEARSTSRLRRRFPLSAAVSGLSSASAISREIKVNAQALSHILIRAFSYVCFIRLPYGPVQRIGKPDLGGRVILAPTHNNFYCDITVAGSETPKLPRWMAKVGLFRKPFDLLRRFFGPIPGRENNTPNSRPKSN